MNIEKKNVKSLRYTVALLVTAAIWGSGFPITKVVLNNGTKPYEMIGIRFVFAFLLMYIFLKVKKIEIEKSDIIKGLLLGTLLFLAFAFQTVGANYTDASKSALITGFNVVIVPFAYWAISKNKPKALVYFTSVMCLLGMAILSLEVNLTGRESGILEILHSLFFSTNFKANYGDFLTLMCAIFYAFHIATTGHVLKKSSPMVINCFQMLSAGILGIIVNYFYESGSILTNVRSIETIKALAFIIIFNTTICFLLQTYCQKYVAPSRVAVTLSTEMVFGALLSVMFLGDPLNWQILLGGSIIFTSILISELNN